MKEKSVLVEREEIDQYGLFFQFDDKSPIEMARTEKDVPAEFSLYFEPGNTSHVSFKQGDKTFKLFVKKIA